MARPTSDGKPKYLSYGKEKGYRLRLINGVRKSLAFNRAKAFAIANQYNLQMRPEVGVETLLSISKVQNQELLSAHIPEIHNAILEREELSEKVRDALRLDMERAKEFFTIHPHDIDLTTVNLYLNRYHSNLKGESFNKKISFLKKLFKYAIDAGLMKENPAKLKLVKPLKDKDRKRMTLEQYKVIHKECPLWLQTAMDLSLQTTHARLEVTRIKYRISKPSKDSNGCIWFEAPIIDQETGQEIFGELYINRQKTKKNEEAHKTSIRDH